MDLRLLQPGEETPVRGTSKPVNKNQLFDNCSFEQRRLAVEKSSKV
jgi:hypothetical protein